MLDQHGPHLRPEAVNTDLETYATAARPTSIGARSQRAEPHRGDREEPRPGAGGRPVLGAGSERVEEGNQPRFLGGREPGEPIAGTGVIQVEQTFLDNPLTRGAVDVVFPDGTRLLADFAAPICATE